MKYAEEGRLDFLVNKAVRGCPMENGREDLEDVLKEETSRGRRPVDATARRRRRNLLRELSQTLRQGDERGFLKIVRALGLRDGSPEFATALRLWRDARRRPK